MASPSPAFDSLRLQLEGRWTHLEQAQTREAHLLQLLGARHWMRHQPQWLTLLSEVHAQEPTLQAVMTYVEERAAREQWPREHPGLAALGELHTRRAALRKVIHQRLAVFAPRDDVPFVTLLEHLKHQALEPKPSPPSPEEFIVAHGWGLSGAWPGRYWLMAKRLLWRPWGGMPVQVRLASPPEGPRRWSLSLVRHAHELETLLSTQEELLHAPSSRLDDDTVVVCPASLCLEGFPTEPRWGVAIFHPPHVTFVPTHRPTPREHLRRLLSKAIPVVEPSRQLWHEALIDRLRRLSPPRFDAAVAALCQTRAGQHWPGAEFQRAEHSDEALQFKCRGYILSIPRARRPDALQPFLERHFPHAARAPQRPLEGEWHTAWMSPLVWHQAIIVVSFFLYPMALEWLSDPTAHFPVRLLACGAGQLTLAWTCMRYAKSRGRSPLWGLLGSTCNIFGVLLLLMPPGRKPADPR